MRCICATRCRPTERLFAGFPPASCAAPGECTRTRSRAGPLFSILRHRVHLRNLVSSSLTFSCSCSHFPIQDMRLRQGLALVIQEEWVKYVDLPVDAAHPLA